MRTWYALIGPSLLVADHLPQSLSAVQASLPLQILKQDDTVGR